MNRHTTHLIALAAVLGVGAPATASAAPPWTPPAAISPQSGGPLFRADAQLAANRRGLAIAVGDGAGRPGDVSGRTVASVFDGTRFGAPFEISGPDVNYGPHSGAIATYAATRLLAAGRHSERDSAQAVFAFGRLTADGASLGEPRPLGPSDLLAGPAALAVNHAGDAAMVYPVCRASCARVLVYLAVRRHGSSSISSTRLFEGSGPLPRVAAAVNARGDALAVWTTAAEVRARVRTLGGRLRPTQRVGPTARGSVTPPSASLSKHRGELVGWFGQAVHEGEAGPGATYVAQARDGGTFSTATKVAEIPGPSPATYAGNAGIRVAFDAFGRRLVMWSGYEHGRYVVRSGEVLGAANSGRADLTDVQLVSDPATDTILTDMEVGADGRQYALLDAGVRPDAPVAGTSTIVAALRAGHAEGAFQREAVSDGSGYVRGADGAIAGPDRALAIWYPLQGDDMTSLRQTPLP